MWLVTHSILVALLPWCSTFYCILQFIQTAHGLWYWVCRNRSNTEIFCWRQGKQEQLTVPSLFWSTQSLRSIFKIGILFHMLRVLIKLFPIIYGILYYCHHYWTFESLLNLWECTQGLDITNKWVVHFVIDYLWRTYVSTNISSTLTLWFGYVVEG